MAPIGKAENFIENISGCGPFQVIILFVVVTSNLCTSSYTIMFMAFGNYNPGWRCLDNVTTPNSSITTTDPGDAKYTIGSCEDYKSCSRVEFNPETSTIVTEWGLLCDKSWMSSITISVQMAGMLVFSFLCGQLADTLGRKKTLYGSVGLCAILQLGSAFSVSWSMLVVIQFFLCGLCIANFLIMWLYVAEFMTIKWRASVISFPFWYVGSTIQAVTAMITKDWRQLFMVGFVLHVICFLPVFWVPESLRWLEVKSRSEQFDSVARKIVFWNKTDESLMLDNENKEDLMKDSNETKGDVKKYTIIDIFRHGYTLISICMGLITFTFGMVLFATAFGTKLFYGDFYINLIVMNVIAIPVFLLAIVGVKYMSRKGITFVSLSFGSLCMFGATGLLFTSSETAKSIGATVLIAVSRSAIDATWFATYSRATEIYPTVVRGSAVGFASLAGRAGGILAPFLIPEAQEELYIFTIITASLALVTCVLSFALPETKGKPLKDSFEKRVYEIELTVDESST